MAPAPIIVIFIEQSGPLPALVSWESGDEILRAPSHEGLYVVYELIGQKLHCAVARPGHMRREDKIRQAQLKQRIALLGWLLCEDVEAGAGDQALRQRLNQRPFIHQSPARRIDQNGGALHLAELLDADHVARLSGQGHVQRYDIALYQHLFKRSEYDSLCLRRRVIGKQDLHPKAARDVRRSLAEHSLADDAEGCAVEISNRVVEETELVDLLPPASFHIL